MNWVSLIFIGILLIGMLGGVGFFVLMASGYKYIFLLYSRDGNNCSIVKAKITSMEGNKKQKYFLFKGSQQTLMITEPTTHFNGKPARMITYNNRGEYIYIKGNKLDDKDYKVNVLANEERELALWQYQQNQRKHQTVDTTSLVTMVVSVIMLIIVMIGTVYSVYSLGRTLAETVQSLDQIGAINNQQAIMIELLNENVEAFNSILDSGSGILRVLT